MQANILCPHCKNAILNVELLGRNAEFGGNCPNCGPVSGFVVLNFHTPSEDIPEVLAS